MIIVLDTMPIYCEFIQYLLIEAIKILTLLFSSSQVFAADLFFTNFKDDITNSERGQKYRQAILEKGGCQNHMQALSEFLGRAPSAKAFESLLGI